MEELSVVGSVGNLRVASSFSNMAGFVTIYALGEDV